MIDGKKVYFIILINKGILCGHISYMLVFAAKLQVGFFLFLSRLINEKRNTIAIIDSSFFPFFSFHDKFIKNYFAYKVQSVAL